MTPHDTVGAQVRLLVGGLVLIASLLTVATVAATQLWLSLTVSVVLLAMAAAGLRYGVPRVLVLVTLGFVAVLLGAAAMQWSTLRRRSRPLRTARRRPWQGRPDRR